MTQCAGYDASSLDNPGAYTPVRWYDIESTARARGRAARLVPSGRSTALPQRSLNASALSVHSQVNAASSRPKCP